MKTFLFVIAFFASTTSFANDQFYNFRFAGKVSLVKLAEEMSYGLSGSNVKITNIRGSYNPFDYGHINFNQYVIFFTLNKMHRVKCSLTELVNEAKFMISDCSTSNASVHHEGFIYFKNLGVSIDQY